MVPVVTLCLIGDFHEVGSAHIPVAESAFVNGSIRYGVTTGTELVALRAPSASWFAAQTALPLATTKIGDCPSGTVPIFVSHT